jgi:hypothetical protein
MNTTNTGLAGIKKLKGRANYEDWCTAMGSYLDLEDLWEAVEGKISDYPFTNGEVMGREKYNGERSLIFRNHIYIEEIILFKIKIIFN